MKKIRIVTLIISVVLLLMTVISCGQSTVKEPEATEGEETSGTITEEEPDVTEEEGGNNTGGALRESDYLEVYEAIEPDTVMLISGGYEVKWDELFFYIKDSMTMYSDTALYESIDFEYVLESAVAASLTYPAVLNGANSLGVTLTEADKEEIAENVEAAIEQMGSEAELLDQIWKNSGIVSIELFEHILGLDKLIQKCYEAMFGSGGELVTDEMIQETIGDEYMLVKHILRLKPEGGSESDNEKAYKEAEEILEQLREYEGEDFDEYFDELMMARSEDGGGVASYPDGYLFTDGDMVPEFYEGSRAIGPGELSEIIETTYGYHIIYRKPIDYDMVPFRYSNQGYNTTMRQLTANYIFNETYSSWFDGVEEDYTEAYDRLDLEEMFVR